MSSIVDLLRERGFIYGISDEEGLARALEHPVTLYSGFDPTGASLTVGHLVPIMLMRFLQKAGHRTIALVGGGTARIGDPSGKTTERPMLSGEEIDRNGEAFRGQLSRFLDLQQPAGILMDNKDWLLGLEYIPFLREIGRHFSVNQMLAAEVYKTRLETGLSFLTFNYMLLQAYDFLHLYRTEGCLLYVGGSDQWSNSLAGVDLIRRVEGRQAFTLVSPLLTTASGQKMGKTEKGAVWLDPGRTSPYEYYQFWINTDDGNVERFLALFTELPMEEVRSLGKLEGAAIREAKERLALEATALAHGREAAEEARAASRAMFGSQGPDGDGNEAAAPSAPTRILSPADLDGLTVGQLFVLAGLASSKNEARRLIAQGGAQIDGERVQAPDAPVDPEPLSRGVLLRAGKKKFARVILGEKQNRAYGDKTL